MAHRTSRSAYERLSERLNRYPQGAPPSELLFKILRMLFRENEAALVSMLPIKPFTAQKAAAAWKTSSPCARKCLESLADRALLVDFGEKRRTWCVLPHPMAGFFEFSLRRVRGDIDQKALSELYFFRF